VETPLKRALRVSKRPRERETGSSGLAECPRARVSFCVWRQALFPEQTKTVSWAGTSGANTVFVNGGETAREVRLVFFSKATWKSF
jgi:hypothetical protein